MSISSGDPSEEVVRIMLSGAEVTLRLTASAAKNLLAISIALTRHHKTLCGKTSMKKMLKETRDLRAFHMSHEEFQRFKRESKKFRLLYSYVRERDSEHGGVDVILPVTELGRANILFERIHYGQENAPAQENTEPESGKECPSSQDSNGTRQKTTSRESGEPSRRTSTTSERPSVLKKLEGYKRQLEAGQTGGKTKETQKSTKER